MKQNKQLIEAWRNGVRLRDAWWQFADAPIQKEFLDLKSEELHLDLEHSLKADLTHRLYSGGLRAIGVESESRTKLYSQPLFSEDSQNRLGQGHRRSAGQRIL
jgi:hypothetical protein